MPVTLTITGNTGPEAVGELFAFLSNLQLNLNNAAGVASKGAETASAPAANTNSAEAEAPKKRKAKEEKAEEPKGAPAKTTSKFTLQEAIDKAKAIAGDGKDETIMLTIQKINTSFGVKLLRELPVEKIDAYMEELDKAFPPAAKGSMFD